MRYKQLGGITTVSDTALPAPDGPITRTFEADGAIPVGTAVTVDFASDATGKLVIQADAALDHRQVVGIYAGVGGTGAAATVSGTSGKAAVDGDIIEVVTYGVAYALQDGTTDTVPGEALAIEATTGYLIGGITAVTNGTANAMLFTCMEAVTTDGAAGRVYVKCM